MLSDVSFGQYYPTRSFVHEVDPRAKILFMIGFIVTIFVATNFYGLLVCATVLALVIAFSGVPVGKVFRSVKGILILVIFTAVLNILFYRGETILWEWEFIVISLEGLFFSAFLIIRLVLLVICSSLLTYTTTPVALTDGLESLMYPLKWIRFPVHELALIMSIALRFIPILMDETNRIMNAQKARGADFETGSLMSRIKAVVPILIPLILSAFRRAEELGDAMDARCYNGSKNRTKYKKLRFGYRDLIVTLVLALLITAVVLLRVYLVANI